MILQVFAWQPLLVTVWVAQVVDPASKEFKLCNDYLQNTHAVTHNTYTMELQSVFHLEREGEADRYKKFASMHNRQLLWHGSRWLGAIPCSLTAGATQTDQLGGNHFARAANRTSRGPCDRVHV